MNQDGASNGLTAPNGPSQQRVIREALASAGLGAADVDVVEGHGTGTVLGDPIEAQALLATYGAARDVGSPLWLGSLKSNIGHAQAAAGVGGVIKMVEAMRHQVMPRTLHVDAPSSKVDWASGAVRLLTEERPWLERGRPRRAGVSSFGISGTNAHVIVEQVPDDAEVAVAPSGVPVAWVLSGRTPQALRAQAERLAAHVDADKSLGATDIGFTLASRPVFEHRAVVIGEDRQDLLTKLAAVAADSPTSEAVSGLATDSKTAFVFPGQGAQWLGMGRELYDAMPTFAQTFDEVLEELGRHSADQDLRSVLWGEDAGLVRDTGVAQPVLFAIGVALSRVLRGWGVMPDFVLGHSVGGITAAYVAGVLSLEDAARLVMARARLMQALPRGGSMVAVRAGEADVRVLLVDGADIAAVNAPRAVVVSGAESAVAEVVVRATEAGFKTEQLVVSHAFHSALMEPMLEAFTAELGQVSFTVPRAGAGPVWISDADGRPADERVTAPDYWVRHARGAVRFADGIAVMLSAGVRRFAVLGPDGGLSGLIAQNLDQTGESQTSPIVAAGLRRNRSERASLWTTLAELFVAGAPVDWRAAFAATGGRRVDLPVYPFQHERYWLLGRSRPRDVAAVGQQPAEHPLLGAVVGVPGTDQVLLTGRLSVRDQAWLADHAVFGRVVVPGSVFVEMAMCAADRAGCTGVRELTFRAPLALSADRAVDVSVVVAASGPETEPAMREVSVYSRPADEEGADWVLHAQGALIVDARDEPPAAAQDLADWPVADAEAVELAGGYEDLAERGYGYGPAFRGVRGLWRRGEDVFAEIALEQGTDIDVAWFGVHPALLDAVVHSALLVPDDGKPSDGEQEVALPFAWEGVRRYSAGASLLRARISPNGDSGAVSVVVADEAGKPVLSAESFMTRPVSAAQLGGAQTFGRSEGLFELAWSPVQVPEGVAQLPGTVVVEVAGGADGADDVVSGAHAA
ncbi:type I polyketide synthase, partial [Mycobacterium sp.]|uniref:type I polyketide synthase n=1 Tax=Mycobacterium sp. TaxID=1785 RepID=UPI00261DC38B